MVRINSLRRVALVLALFTAAILVLMQFGRPSFTNASRPPQFGDPVLALQFVRNVEDVDWILGDAPSPDREVMRIKQYIDYAFIVSYIVLFLALALIVTRMGGWKQATGIAAGICGVATGVFDALENRAILNMLDVPLRFTTPSMLNAIRGASTAKWSLAAATLILLSSYFVPSSKKPS